MRGVWRGVAQLGATVGLTYLFLRQDYATASRPFFTWAGWLDPLTGLAGLVRGLGPWLIVISLGALLVAGLFGRIFCGWCCPVGGVLDLLAGLKKLIRWPDRYPGVRARRWWNLVRWVWAGVAVGLTLSGRLWPLIADPLVLWARDVHRVGQSLIPWSAIGLLLLGLLVFPRFWCRYLCPAGSVFGLACRLTARRRSAGEDCLQCGLCERRCPMQNIGEGPKFGHDCVACGRCTAVCPKRLSVQGKRRARTDEDRRAFLAAAGAGLAAFVVGSAGAGIRPAASARWPRLLRPPGALVEMALSASCTRCGQCLQVCPTKCLVPAGLEAGLGGLWTPRFVPRRGRCMFCEACGRVCPTGALVPVTQETARLGTAKIATDLCLAWREGTKCLLCVETCPTFAIAVDARERPVIDTAKCIGCGACEAGCPVDGSAVTLTFAGEVRRFG